MPKPPPRSSSGISTPSSSETRACRVSTRRVATSKPEVSKIWRADVGVQARAGRAAEPPAPGGPPRRRRPRQIEKPNFWSSWAVAMYSWVCASTPAVTRTITPTGASCPAASSASRSISSKESTTIRPTPASTARRSSAHGLVVAVEADPGRVDAGAQRDGQLAGRADVEAQPLLGDPAGDRGAEERLAGVVDVVALERLRKARARPRKSASSRTYAGEPCSATRSRRSTPPTSRAPSSFLRAVDDHSCGTRVLTSSGSRSQDGPRAPSACAQPASWARTASHPLGGGDPEQVAGRWRDGLGGVDAAAAARRGSVPAPRRPSAAPGRRRRTCGSCRAVSSR